MDQTLNLESFFDGLSWDTSIDALAMATVNGADLTKDLPTPTPSAIESNIGVSTPAPAPALATAPAKFQVCGNCRRKKRRCSLERPSCSLCRENGLTCEYRNMKKKPGPAKGTVGLRAPILEDRLKKDVAITMTADVKNVLIGLYFTHIQPNVPMFCRKSFEQDLAEKRIPDRLLYAMFALSSKFLPPSEVSILLGPSCTKPWDAFARLAQQKNYDEENINGVIILSDIKTEVLLTQYEYTNFPGRKAWMMMGNLVRLAVGLGLHRIDCDERISSLSDLEQEEYRYVWWAVWKLDSAINVLTSSLFGVDNHSIGTALVTTSIADFTAGISTKSTRQFLPTDSARSWKVAQQLLLTDTEDGMKMYLFAVCHLRTISVCRQRLFANPTTELVSHLMVLRNTLPCLRLSLPQWYFEPARQPAFETANKHRLRLETILIFFVSQVQAFLPFSNSGLDDLTSSDSLANWKSCISTSEDIASIFHHWKPEYFKVADPMISAIIWYTCSILAIHSMAARDQLDEAPDARIVNALDLLSLALENFARQWQMSRLLLDSVKNLQIWAWMRIDFPETLSLLAQLRVPIDPSQENPGSINMWQIVAQKGEVVEDITPLQQLD